eukprot:4407864-Pyramimonas_sp.AAC.1
MLDVLQKLREAKSLDLMVEAESAKTSDPVADGDAAAGASDGPSLKRAKKELADEIPGAHRGGSRGRKTGGTHTLGLLPFTLLILLSLLFLLILLLIILLI